MTSPSPSAAPASLSPALTLTSEERAACAVCSDWLATAPAVAVVAWLAVAAALFGLSTGGAPHPVVLLVPLAIAERVLAVRVAFDARLFGRLASGMWTDLPALDRGLQQVLAVPATKAGRPLAPRIAGARRLYRWHVGATVGLVVLAIAAWI